MGFVVTFRAEAAGRYAGRRLAVEAESVRRESGLLVFLAPHGRDYNQREHGVRSVCVLPADDVAAVEERDLELAEVEPGKWAYVPC